MTLGAIAFTTPWLLLALAALPILWLLLRAIPPAPVRRRFPAVTLLLGLKDDDSVSDRTPWWLLLLRTLALAAIIIGLSGPVLNPNPGETGGDTRLLIVMDAGWASADDWDERVAKVDELLGEAARAGRLAAISRLARPEQPDFRAASELRQGLPALLPFPWLPSEGNMERFASMLPDDPGLEIVWFSDGLEREGRVALIEAFESAGPARIIEASRAVLAIAAPRYVDGQIEIKVFRSRVGFEQSIVVQAFGTDPNGVERVLAEENADFGNDLAELQISFSLPSEIRARISRFTVKGQDSAGAVALSDDNLRQREVALVAVRENREGLELLSPLHFLRKALQPNATILEGALGDVLPANPDVVVLADVAELSPDEEAELTAWIEEGGTLLRFAGPRMAASDVGRQNEHALMPVRLRAGGRTVGGAMSWGEAKTLAPFEEGSPFFGLDIPADVSVTSQVLAQPDPELSQRVLARLSDGTPLVTSKSLGGGRVTFFHVTANAEWSTLPLSGLFVDMLDRLAVSTSGETPSPEDLAGTVWKPISVLNGFGGVEEARNLPGVAGDALVSKPLGPELRPGLYQQGERTLARNTLQGDESLSPMIWPGGVSVEGMTRNSETPLAGWFLIVSLLLLGSDVFATLALSGQLAFGRKSGVMALVIAVALWPADAVRAQDDRAIAATSEVVLAHVLTGNRTVDDTARAGLFGLSKTLFFRTSVEPNDPFSVDLEQDELAFFPLLYWPITPDQPRPSEAAYEKLNLYLRSGGMILFDTRDGDISGYGAASPNGRKLQQLAAPLDIPAIEPIPADHVLTRTFYLLQEFPGRYSHRGVWVEASPPDAERIEGMPFRNLNDGVTPVVIGGNDWAAAWAMDASGNPLFPVGRGISGERQREMAYRFGVNLIMHVLTGNYKSDQVHVPALLDRLGQ